MIKQFIIILTILILNINIVLADRFDREFSIEEEENNINLYIETTEEAESMYIKIDGVDYIGIKEKLEKNYYKFLIPKEIYNKYENMETFIDSLYINESGEEVNILRNSRENTVKEKENLNEINNQLVTEEKKSLDKNNKKIEDELFEKNSQNYFNKRKKFNIKINPFFIIGLLFTVLGIIMNFKIKNKS